MPGIFTTGIQVRRVAGDLTVSIVHPQTKQPTHYSLARLPGVIIGQDVNVQPVLVDSEPIVIVSYKHQGEVISMELEPVMYAGNGFDLSGAVFGEEYKRQKETVREQNAKRLDAMAGEGPKAVPFAAVTNGEGFKTHSLIKPEGSPFIRQRTGEQVSVAQADTVKIHDLLISHFEFTRRVTARIGYTPEDLMDRMKREYPEGVPSSLVPDVAEEYELRADSAAL
jgi:hypothetical protein